MRARTIKRWLWGLLVMGLALVVMAGRVHGKPALGSPAPAPVVVPQVHIAPFAAPASMPALGEELARGFYAALRDANIPARLGKGDEGSAIVGRLEELSQTQVRLHASYHGHGAQSVGDLEHLDDLVYAVFTQLRPRLQTAADSRSGALEPATSASDPPPAVVVGSALPAPPTVDTALTSPSAPSKARPSAASKEAATDSAHPAPVRLASVKEVTAHPVRPTPASHRPAEARPASPPPGPAAVPATVAAAAAKESKESKETKEPVVANPPSLPSPPTVTEPVAEPPRVAPVAPVPVKTPSTPRPPLTQFTFDPRRPRVAVHVVGEPLARTPAGYSGLGTVGQQSIITYLQQRLRVPAVASRLAGLTGGLAALDQSLRVGARHTLMARLDGLVLNPSPSSLPGPMGGGFTGGTLSGRIHIVLLLDGKLLLDRSVMLPPILVLPSETPAQAYSRSLFTAMDAVAGELASRLTEPVPTSTPPSR